MKETTVEGFIATHDRKHFRGVITIDTKTGLITKVSKPGKNRKADHVFGNDSLIFAGFGDVHVHAREDQTGEQNYKEEYKTTADAALHGGVVHVSAMPNTPHPLVSKQDFAWHRHRIAELSHPVSILNYVGIDLHSRPLGKPGEHMYKLFFGRSVGPLTVIHAVELDEILQHYQGHHIAFHVEYEPIVRASISGATHSDRRPIECVIEGLLMLLPLIEKYNIKAKFCHWSIGDRSFELVEEYRKRGCYIEVEVSPLHLMFDTSITDKDSELWTKIQMNPAIRTPRHRAQLIKALRSGFIQYLATDHAPHTVEEKFGMFAKYREQYPGLSNVEIGTRLKNENPPEYYATCKENGMSGAPWLDVYGLVCAWLLNEHKFRPQDVARVASYMPGKFVNPHLKRQFSKQRFGKGFGEIKKGFVGSLTVLNLKKKTKVRREDVKTKCGWSPLEGRTMPGAIEAVFIRGKRYDA